eukprot:EG_transcript_7334
MDPNAVFLFAFIWCQTQLFHLCKEWHQWSADSTAPTVAHAIYRDMGRPRPWLVLALAGLGGWVVLRGLRLVLSNGLRDQLPDSNRLLRQLVVFSALSFVYLMLYGSNSNHIVMDLFLNASVVFAALPPLLVADHSLAFSRVMTAFQVQTVVLYFIAMVHKMNSGWFDPEVSCASQVMGMVMQQLFPSLFPPTAAHTQFLLQTNPYFAALVEVLLVVGLALPFSLDDPDEGEQFLLRRFKRCVATVGISMHIYLALPLPPSSFYPFSVVMVPLYISLFPHRVASAAARANGRVVVLLSGLVLTASTLFWTRFVTGSGEPFYEYPPYGIYNFSVGWVVLCFIGLGSALWSTPPSALTLLEAKAKPPARWPELVGIGLCPLCILALGSLPFFGLRTYPAFAMFSNLRVEGCASNHLLIPQFTAGLVEDFVEIQSTDIPALQNFQVDLSELYHAPTRQFLQDAGLQPALWICPPNWTRPARFQPYLLPAVAFRRVVTARGFPHTPSGRGSVVVTIYKACEPVDRQRIAWPLTAPNNAIQELLQPLNWWQRSLARFRAFDLYESVCRH